MTTTDTERVTLEIFEGPTHRRDDDGWEHYAYGLRLVRGDRDILVPWKQGTGIEHDPTARDVLESLLMDASGIENARGNFEEWASEYGFDPDSRKAEAIFRQASEQTENLRDLLGDDFDAAVFPTARDDFDSERVVRRLAQAD